MAQKPRRAGVVHLARHRRIVVEAQPEIRSGQLLVVQMRIASEVCEEALHDRQNQALVRLCDLAEECFVFRKGPELRGALEGAPAEDPTPTKSGLLFVVFLDGKKPLITEAE